VASEHSILLRNFALTDRLTENKYASRFSLRRKNSKWHEKTKVRALKLLREGKMTPAGMAVLPPEVLKMWKKQG